MFAVPAGESYNPSQTLLLDLSGPLGWGGEGNVERGKERKGKGGIGKGGVALAPGKKFLRHPRFNLLLLNWFKDGKLIETGSSFRN